MARSETIGGQRKRWHFWRQTCGTEGGNERAREGTQGGFKEGTTKVRERRREEEAWTWNPLSSFGHPLTIWCFAFTHICSYMNTHALCVHTQNACWGKDCWGSAFEAVGRDVKLLLYASIDFALISLSASRPSVPLSATQGKRWDRELDDSDIKMYLWLSLLVDNVIQVVKCFLLLVDQEVWRLARESTSGADKDCSKVDVCQHGDLNPHAPF